MSDAAKSEIQIITRLPVERWREYRASSLKRLRALAYKSIFKLCYY